MAKHDDPEIPFLFRIKRSALLAFVMTQADMTIGLPDEPTQRKPHTKRLPKGSAPLMLTGPDTKGTKKQNRGENTAASIMLAKMQEHPKTVHTLKELSKACDEGGSSAKAASVAMVPLIKSGQVERVSQGRYILGRNGVAAPAEEAPAKKRHTKPNKEVVMEMFAKGEPVPVKAIAAKFRQQHREPNSVSPVIASLKANKLIVAVSKGVYQLASKDQENG
jgi:hypothetical protein